MSPKKDIPTQIRLPLKVAYGVVLQGIRIRFGRSLVTLSGVIFGIAFLMSILTGQLLKRGVQEEQQARSDVNRMTAILTASTGPLSGRTLTLVGGGTIPNQDLRFLRRLIREDVGTLEWITDGDSAPPDGLPNAVAERIRRTDWSEAGEGVAGLLLLGDAARSPEPLLQNIPGLLDRARQRVVALGDEADREALGPNMEADVANLHPPLRPEEAEERLAAERREQFRFVWILAVASLVTIIGIANAMLMSVTERFREIGTMKCLGALSGFIRQIFLMESSLLGLVGSVIGAVGGMLFSILIYGFTYGFGTALQALNVVGVAAGFIASIVAGILFSVVAALYPARVASRMVPAVALRSNV